MLEVAVMISNGENEDPYRDCAKRVIERLNHMFRQDLNQALYVTNWDYRLDPPGVVPAGDLAVRSLSMVTRSEALVAIFGSTVPDITAQEVRRAFEKRRRGTSMPVWTFLNPGLKGHRHETFVEEIRNDFNEQIVWAHYTDLLDFQGLLFTTLTPYLLKRSGANFPPTMVA